eukprot:1302358-Lingulodinium_polyedra.AAC.1
MRGQGRVNGPPLGTGCPVAIDVAAPLEGPPIILAVGRLPRVNGASSLGQAGCSVVSVEGVAWL